MKAFKIRLIFVAAFLAALAGCNSQEREARTKLAILRLAANNTEIDQLIEEFERFIQTYPETTVTEDAKSELKYLFKVKDKTLPAINEQAEAIGKAAVEIYEKEQKENKPKKDGVLLKPAEMDEAVEAGIIADKARKRLNTLFDLAKRFHLGARAFYVANAFYSAKTVNYGMHFDSHSYTLTVIPFNKNKVGYQNYSCEVRDDDYPAYMTVNRDLEFNLVVKPKAYAKKLLQKK